jgi:hypothetical protein
VPVLRARLRVDDAHPQKKTCSLLPCSRGCSAAVPGAHTGAAVPTWRLLLVSQDSLR